MSKNQKPTGVTFIELFVLGVALWNGLRLVQAIIFWSVLKEYQAEPGTLYIAISGGFWSLAALFILKGIWQGKTWAWVGTIGFAVGYGLWYWFDRLVLEEPHANWPFALAFTVLLVGLFAFILFSPKTRTYFNINI
jgi:hypothetical protein